MSDITLAQAQSAVAAAEKKAAEIGTKMDIAIVDAGANLKAFARMDGAWLGSIDIAIKKARTARFFDMNTGDIGQLSQPGGALYNIEHSNGGLITFPGGVPIRNGNGEVIGAIGVSINAAIIILSGLRADERAMAGDVDAVQDVVGETARHISSTTITTFGGFLPLLLSEGGFWPPFATVIAGGVLMSTIVSFFFVPQAFLVVRRFKKKAPDSSALAAAPA